MLTFARSAVVTVLGLFLLLVVPVGLGQAQGPVNEQGLALEPVGGGGPGPVTTGFTYQGQLRHDGQPVNTACDFSFSLWDSQSGGAQIGSTEAWPNHQVTNGLFQVYLNASAQFSGEAFKGQQRYLQVAVRCPAGSGTYTTLERELLAAVPYAISLMPGAIVKNTAAVGGWTPGLWLESTNGHALAGLGFNASAAAIQGDHRGGGMGVFGITTSTAASGKAGVGAHNAGTGPGLLATSAGGVAARFEKDSSTAVPQVLLHENANDYARLSFDNTGSSKFWTVAGYSPTTDADARLNFYHSAYGDVLSLTGDGKAYVNGRLITRVLEITGGSDLAEAFEVKDGAAVEPGSLMVIDAENPGHLSMSITPYDTKVAGIVSGAGSVKPGLTLQQEGVLEGDVLVAIAGRVYVKAEALSAPIMPGDLLTTSAIPGHAMKATDRARAQGAIIGKAMTGLAEGQGLVLVLVSLQ